MQPTAGRPPQGAQWAFEFKWDGVRALAAASSQGVRLISRTGRDVSTSYPELKALSAHLGKHRVVLDGEIIVEDATGRPDFAALQTRMHRVRPDASMVSHVPVSLYVFDLLVLDSTELLRHDYERRRARLAELELGPAPRVRVPDHFLDVTGEQMLEIAGGHELEGIVAKRLSSRYQPGQRTREWIKTALRHTLNVVIGGWVTGSGTHAGLMGSLLVGVPDEQGRLHYAGHVGTGFSEHDRSVFRDALDELGQRHSPFAETVPPEFGRQAQWVEPVLVAEVEYRQWTPDGRLRAPSFRRLCPELHAQDAQQPSSPA